MKLYNYRVKVNSSATTVCLHFLMSLAIRFPETSCTFILLLLLLLLLLLSSSSLVDLGGLRVTCSPRDPRFAGSNPAEVDGFFQDVKILSTSPPGGTLG